MTDTGVVFAGQGAQSIGMGKGLAERFPEARALYERADEVLGYGLSTLCFEGPLEELTRSNHCQPGIFVTSVVCYEALKRRVPDLTARAVAGLSLGEWTALYAGGAISFEDALRVLEARGRFMQEACEQRDGAMVSVIGLPAEALEPLCATAGVEMANLNSEQQTVLSGERTRILEAERLAGEAGAKRTVVLNVAGAFHSSLMAPAAERLESFLADVRLETPTIPVIANVTGQPHGSPEAIRRLMVRQVTQSVRWLSCVQWFMDNGVSGYLECGPGKVLSGLIKRIHKGAGLHNVEDVDSLERTAASMAGGSASSA